VTDLGLRLGVTAVLGAGVVAGRLGLIAWRDQRRSRALAGRPLPDLAAGEPTVLLFTGTLCSDCIRQKRILVDLRRRLGGWRMRELHAAKEGPLAARFGIQSVPATVLLGPEGRSVAVNYGLVQADVLVNQLRPLVAASA